MAGQVAEVRLHGKGGQGIVIGSELIAHAAVMDGKFARTFPEFTSARRGAPVVSYLFIGEATMAARSAIVNPEYLVVFDPKIHTVVPGWVFGGFRENGVFIQNTTRSPDEVLEELKTLVPHVKPRLVATLDATGIALKHTRRPIPNIAIVGAFSKVTNLVKVDLLAEAVKARFPQATWENNLKVLEEGYNSVTVKEVR
ncbi:MAG: 2-oxoacid:acceptor oxidoreductase family protein [Desulfurococcaceae archaeon]